GANASGVSQDLTRIRAEGNVVVLSENDQRARGDWAVFDVKANTITVGGNVELQQGRQKIRGDRLVINTTTGLTRIVTQPSAATASGKTRQRMRATIYRSDVQKLQKQRKNARRGTGTTAKMPSSSSWSPVEPRGQ
ncbi:MAG: LptA/OstA family protein, partial [Pseudomonadota bacterium]